MREKARLIERFNQVLSQPATQIQIPRVTVAKDLVSVCFSGQIEEITTNSTSQYDLAVL
jgi:hypothetical protein